MTKTSTVTNLQKAFNRISSVKARPGILAGRSVIDVTEQMDIKRIPIAQFLTLCEELKPIKVQRNDLYRLSNGLAKYLADFELPQGVFSLVYWGDEIYLVDGNTRKRAWLTGKTALPSHVFVMVMVAHSFEHAEAIYNCFDSVGAKKNNRDGLNSMMHEAGINLEHLRSKLIAGGKFVSVVNNMVRQAFAGNATAERKKFVVNEYSKAILCLDTLRLNEKELLGAAVWAGLELYKAVPTEYHSVVDRYVNELRKVNNPALAREVSGSVTVVNGQALRLCVEKGISKGGEKPIRVMFPTYISGFLLFAKYSGQAVDNKKKFNNFLNKKLTPYIEELASKVLATI